MQKELADLEEAARELVGVVDLNLHGRALIEHLRDAPVSIAGYASGTSKVVLTHVLALVKTYVPWMPMESLEDGTVDGCTQDQFNKYPAAVEPVAHRIVDAMRDDLF